MKPIKYFLSLLLIPTCILFTSCNFFSGNGSGDSVADAEKYGKQTFNKILDAVENENKDEFIDLFSNKVRNDSAFDSIDDAFKLYKGKRQSIDYNYSVEVAVVEKSERNVFDECLAYVTTNEDTYSFDFLLSKNEDSKGIVSLVMTTEELRESDEYSEFLIETFDEATYFNKDYLGVFIFE